MLDNYITKRSVAQWTNFHKIGHFNLVNIPFLLKDKLPTKV